MAMSDPDRGSPTGPRKPVSFRTGYAANFSSPSRRGGGGGKKDINN